jgi:hypothetical protein
MLGELDKAHDWPEFVSRMAHDFEGVINSRPSCAEDVVCALCKHDDSITPLVELSVCLPELKKSEMQVLPRQMQNRGYYASVQGPWLVCSTNKKRHDAMLFAAQAAQVLAEANMMLVPAPPNHDKVGDRRHAA